MNSRAVLLAVAACGLVLWTAEATAKLPPIIIVPGTGGMQLEARLDKLSTVSWLCTKRTSSYFTLWLDLTSLLPYAINCWMDNMRLAWDLVTMQASNSPGVETRVPGFGDTDTIEYLDSHNLVKYFAPMIKYLASLGYKSGHDMRAAPYDFRYTPGTQPDGYYLRLKALVEDTYTAAGQRPVVLLSHSYGAMITLHFLNTMDDAWKRKHIRNWISISGVFGGTVKQLLLYASGDNFGIPSFLVSPLKVRDEQRTSTSNLFMMPIKELWHGDEVLVNTKTRSYTRDDLTDFFADVGFPEGARMLSKVGDASTLIKAGGVGVPLTCLYGNISASTEESMAYTDAFPDTMPTVVKGDGDGTVNLRSLQHCMVFKQLQSAPVEGQVFPGQTHNGIFEDGVLQQAIHRRLMN